MSKSKKKWKVSRRTILKGFGGTLFLPYLEAMSPLAEKAFSQSSVTVPNRVRVAYLYFPNGGIGTEWSRTGSGVNAHIPQFLLDGNTGLAQDDVRSEFSLVTNVGNRAGGFKPSQPRNPLNGGHEILCSSFLNGAWSMPEDDKDLDGDGVPGDFAKINLSLQGTNSLYRSAVSADHILASHLGEEPLTLSVPGTRNHGNSHYAGELMNHISWKDPTTLSTKTVDAIELFNHIFAAGNMSDPQVQERIQRRLSILDFTKSQRAKLESKLGRADKEKLQEYYQTVSEVENRLVRSGSAASLECPSHQMQTGNFRENSEEMLRLIALAFQCERNHVASFMMELSAYNSGRSGIPNTSTASHSASHYNNDETGFGDTNKNKNHFRHWQRYFANNFAFFLRELKSRTVADGSSLLDHTIVIFGSDIGDGQSHSSSNLPMMVGGGRALGMQPGRQINPGVASLGGIHRSVLRLAGVPDSQHIPDRQTHISFRDTVNPINTSEDVSFYVDL